MNYGKTIWQLFKLDRSDYNRADRKITKLLEAVYQKGKREGAKEHKMKVLKVLKNT